MQYIITLYVLFLVLVAVFWDNSPLGWYHQFCVLTEGFGLALRRMSIRPHFENAIRHASIGAETTMIILAIGAVSRDSNDELLFAVLTVIATVIRFNNQQKEYMYLPDSKTALQGIHENLTNVSDLASLGSIYIFWKAFEAFRFAAANNGDYSNFNYLLLLALSILVYGVTTLYIERCFENLLLRRIIVMSRTGVIALLGILLTML